MMEDEYVQKIMDRAGMKISLQAVHLLRLIPKENLNLVDFVKWFVETKLVIGGIHVHEYIEWLDKQKGD